MKWCQKKLKPPCRYWCSKRKSFMLRLRSGWVECPGIPGKCKKYHHYCHWANSHFQVEFMTFSIRTWLCIALFLVFLDKDKNFSLAMFNPKMTQRYHVKHRNSWIQFWGKPLAQSCLLQLDLNWHDQAQTKRSSTRWPPWIAELVYI